MLGPSTKPLLVLVLGVLIGAVGVVAASCGRDDTDLEYASAVAARIRALQLRTLEESPAKSRELLLTYAVIDAPALVEYARSSRGHLREPACAGIRDLRAVASERVTDTPQEAVLRGKLISIVRAIPAALCA